MELIIPDKLVRGDTVGVVSPSAGLCSIFPHRIEQAEENLRQLGLGVKYAKHAKENAGYVSASARERADDIHEMFLDPEVKAVVASIGGNHSNQLLKYLDFDLIRNHPKIFMGYSDITVLHFALIAKAGLRTYYGPCILPEFGEYPEMLGYTSEYFSKALMSDEKLGRVPASETWTEEFLDWSTKKDRTRARIMSPNQGYEWWREGSAEGQIFGGCIPSVNHLAGTDCWIDFGGKIMFIDIPEGNADGKMDAAELDAYLADLDNLGVFKSIAGLVIGRPYFYDDDDVARLKAMISYYVGPYRYPVLFNVNIGHTSPIMTVPLGAQVRIDSGLDLFEFGD